MSWVCLVPVSKHAAEFILERPNKIEDLFDICPPVLKETNGTWRRFAQKRTKEDPREDGRCRRRKRTAEKISLIVCSVGQLGLQKIFIFVKCLNNN